MTDFPTLSYTLTSGIPTHSYTWSLKKGGLFQAGSPRMGGYGEYSPPGILATQKGGAVWSSREMTQDYLDETC